MCFLLFFLCITGYSASRYPVESQQPQMRWPSLTNVLKGQQHHLSLPSLPEEPPACRRDIPQLTKFTLSTSSLNHSGPVTEILSNQRRFPSGRKGSQLYASRISLANAFASQSDMALRITPNIVRDFPSDHEQDWNALSISAQVKKLDAFLLTPTATYIKMLDWIRDTLAQTQSGPHSETDLAYLGEAKTYTQSLFLMDELQPQQPSVIVFRALLTMGLLNDQPSEDPSPKHWNDLDNTLYQPTENLIGTFPLITHHYAKKIGVIITIIDQISRLTGLEVKFLFEKEFLPTSRCQLLALAGSKVIITLSGIAAAYEGAKVIDPLLDQITYDLASLFLGEVVNGIPAKQLEAEKISSSWRRFFRKPHSSPSPLLPQVAHCFLEWAYNKSNPFKRCMRLTAQELQLFKLVLAHQAILKPFIPLENLRIFSASCTHPDLEAKIDAFCQRRTPMLSAIDLQPTRPIINESIEQSFTGPSDWWNQTASFKNVSSHEFKEILLKVFGFICNTLAFKFSDKTKAIHFEMPRVPEATCITCSTTHKPIFAAMALSSSHFWITFPSMKAIQSINRVIDLRILLDSLSNAIPDLITGLQLQKLPTIPPTPLYIKTLHNAISPHKSCRAGRRQRSTTQL